MGRHSAPSDDSEDQSAVAVLDLDPVEYASSSGRHAVPGDVADAPAAVAEARTELIPAITAPILDEPVRDEVLAGSVTGRIEPITEPVVDVDVAPDDVVQDGAAPADVVPFDAPHFDAASVLEQPADLASVDVAEPGPAEPADSSDFALFRRHADVRARCIAAVIAPFVVYFVVVAILGDLTGRTILIWLWPELIMAGILLGLTLDAGHRRHPATEPGD